LTCLSALLLLMLHPGTGYGQFLSNLHAMRTDALFTTYAAPPARSEYTSDQGYQFRWNDEESGIEFISAAGPNMGIAFMKDKRLVIKLNELFREPVVTTSYSDLVKYNYYPFRDLRVEVVFNVYSSVTAVVQYRFINEGVFPVEMSALPYLYYPSSTSAMAADQRPAPGIFRFELIKKRDDWMVEHHIPLTDTLEGWYSLAGYDNIAGFCFPKDHPSSEIARQEELQKHTSRFICGITDTCRYLLQPGETKSLRVVVSLDGKRETTFPDLEHVLREDEQACAGIPRLKFARSDDELLYWSAFSLLRQCMMPPGGKCSHNYYIFSREPKWGWGYGGQVFHESLAMTAYAYMEPVGAMNSQRVYMERQQPDGYINYRTGPFLDESIETNGQQTSSAPWFNFENIEIFKITGDRKFLREAYDSGLKFYRFYVNNRDADHDGLCEWGGNAELESVRDARVAVWDKVGLAANFEGPDVNSMLVKEAKSLAEMAGLLGLRKESQQFIEEAEHRAALINKFLWDPETRFYYNISKANHTFGFKSPSDLKIREIIGFLPLWAGVADKIQAGFLVEKMNDSTEFRRPYGVPSLSAASDYYCPIGYWNGPVWVQWEYLLYRGLRDYGYEKEARDLSRKVMTNMIHHLKKDHVFWEFYSADDLQAGWNKTYIWAGIAARFLIDEAAQK